MNLGVNSIDHVSKIGGGKGEGRLYVVVILWWKFLEQI